MKIKPKLIHVKFIKRYKRFFADVILNKKKITTHCPNSGSMLGLLKENNNAWISKSDNPNRKLKYTLEIINDKKSNVGVNTHRANRIVEEALENKKIKELKKFISIKREVKFSKETRFDFFLENKNKKAFLEVKNVTLCRQDNISEFPDAVTTRGKKHLAHLQDAIEQGYESYLLFLIQREDAKFMKIASDIDPNYFNEIKKAKKKGVKIIAYSCKVKDNEIKINKNIKVKI
jgi:sugar fermentation stimulation protein A